MIVYLFIELNPRLDSSWQSLSPARRLGGTIWPLWCCITADSEILETAVSLHCGANTKAEPRGSTDWVCLLLSHRHPTGGHAREMKKDAKEYWCGGWHIAVVIKITQGRNCVAQCSCWEATWRSISPVKKCNPLLLWFNISGRRRSVLLFLRCWWVSHNCATCLSWHRLTTEVKWMQLCGWHRPWW